jgi:serine/threonine-protein kinase PknK
MSSVIVIPSGSSTHHRNARAGNTVVDDLAGIGIEDHRTASKQGHNYVLCPFCPAYLTLMALSNYQESVNTEPLFAGRYRIVDRLGLGAQGIALRVQDTLRADAPAVLKLGLSGEERVDGTVAEFEALRNLAIPYIAPVLAMGFAAARDLRVARRAVPEMPAPQDKAPRAFLVRDWVDGPELLSWTGGGAEVTPVLVRLVEAVAELHRVGLVHGDLKPDHVLVRGTEDPTPILIDFGLAAAATRGRRGGTPGYLAPERLRGAPATAASDGFALGVVLVQAYCGSRVRVNAATTASELPPQLLERELPERVLGAVRRLLDPDPDRRPDLDSVRTALMPPDSAVRGWSGSPPKRLPLLGLERRTSRQQWVQRSLRPGRGETPLPPVVFVTGERGSGRSRFLRHLTWDLQRAERATLEVVAGADPWQLLLQLGPQLASISASSYTAPQPTRGDRARWIQDLVDSLVEVLPAEPVALVWDDIAQDALGGGDVAEAMALLLERAPGRLRLWASATPRALPRVRPLFASAGFMVAPLEPLTREDLGGLVGTTHLGRRLSDADLDRLHRRSGGYPGRLVELLRREARELTAGQTGQATVSDTELQALVLTLAGVVPGGATRAEMRAGGVAAGYDADATDTTVQTAIARGIVHVVPPRPDAPGQRAYTALTPHLAELPRPMRQVLGRGLLGLTEEHPVLELLASGLLQDDERLLRTWRRERDRLAQDHARARVQALLEPAILGTRQPEILEAYIEAALARGAFQRAVEVLELARMSATGVWAAQLGVAQARLEFAAGQAPTTLDSRPVDLPGHDIAHAENILAQLALRLGQYPEAQERAQAALPYLPEGEGSAGLRAELQVTAAAAAALQGGRALDVEELDAARTPPRVRARYHAMRAVAAYMQGALDEAVESYRRALEIVEEGGLDAERPVYLLNLGTAYERQARLSLARQYYELGGRCCLPTTRASTRALLLANRANIDIKLGRTREARELLAAASRISQESGLDRVLRFVTQLQADADAADGRLDAAEAVYDGLATEFEALGNKRHATEMHLKAGLAAARDGRIQAARTHSAAAEAHIEEFDDHKPHASILRAEISLARGGIERLAGVDRYLRALEKARESGDDLLVLTEAQWLLRRMREPGTDTDPLAARELAGITSRAWRRVALALTPDLRADLARHLGLEHLLSHDTAVEGQPPPAPAGAAMASLPTLAQIPHPSGAQFGAVPARPTFSPQTSVAADHEKFYQLLSLGRRIVGETELARLIPAALDIALHLSGAERGFLLLRAEDEAPFEVAFSRDIDGRPIDRSHLEISETVALEVARSARPIVTVDAAHDTRFEQALSVANLQLTAILCVPIQDRDRVLGCLYLDHRSHPAVFAGEVPRMMAAFADQVALALLTARRVGELQREKAQLARAQGEVARLLAEKEEMLTDLATRCALLESDLQRERSESGLRFNYDHMIARAPAMQPVLNQIDRVVDTMLPIVIQGESGTGKEVIARTIHGGGSRRRGAFVAVNCGALAEQLLESELFGHKRGAFTGATQDRKGLFEAASGGTLFLDEVGEMSLAMQVKLLRALQEKTIRPVGAIHEIPTDARILAATNRNLTAMVAAGTFREDLYYRLATLVIELPALRDRRDDIPLLVQHVLDRVCRDAGRAVPPVSGHALRLLCDYGWPGNIRQLENVVRAALVMSDAELRPEVVASLLPESQHRGSRPQARAWAPARAPGRPRKCSDQQIADALQSSGGNRAAAARALGISVRTLQRYLTER